MIVERIKNILPSATVEMAARAISMREAGRDIIDLSVGEPDFHTPDHIKQAALEAIHRNYTRYTANRGLQELREAVAAKLMRENQISYQAQEILISSGAKHALFNVLMSIVADGDEVIIPSPHWGSYPEIVSLAGGIPKLVNCSQESGFHLSAENLRQAISPKTRAFVLCNPVNPTGAAYSEEQLAPLVKVLLESGIMVVTDEIYEKLLYDNQQFTSFAAMDPALKKKLIVINGLSKAYAMTGWRIGYAAGPLEVIDAAAKIQSHSTSAASTISQHAAVAALNGPQNSIQRMRAELEDRRNYFVGALQKIPGFKCAKPQGAFYVFPEISSFFGETADGSEIHSSTDFAFFLLEKAGLVVVPGAGFGADNFIRISYATSMENLKKSIQQLNHIFQP